MVRCLFGDKQTREHHKSSESHRVGDMGRRGDSNICHPQMTSLQENKHDVTWSSSLLPQPCWILDQNKRSHQLSQSQTWKEKNSQRQTNRKTRRTEKKDKIKQKDKKSRFQQVLTSPTSCMEHPRTSLNAKIEMLFVWYGRVFEVWWVTLDI